MVSHIIEKGIYLNRKKQGMVRTTKAARRHQKALVMNLFLLLLLLLLQTALSTPARATATSSIPLRKLLSGNMR